MSDGRFGRAVIGGVAAALAVGVVSFPAPAGRNGLDLLVHESTLAAGSTIGLGGDGSVVFFSSAFSTPEAETPIVAEDLLTKPFLADNEELFRWEVDRDAVEQFTATSNMENAAGTEISFLTHNDQPSVDSRTLDLFEDGNPLPLKERALAIAFRSNADQEVAGPSAGVSDVDPRIAILGAAGSTIYVWDYQRRILESVLDTVEEPVAMSLGNPSLAMRTRAVLDRVKGQDGEVPISLELRNILVAFSGDANPAADNTDGNQEIFLWNRRDYLEEGLPGGGGLRNGGITQLTHTTAGASSSPAVNNAGDVAFLSTADITGENEGGVIQLFLWSRGRTRQITHSAAGSIGAPRWSADGRLLVFDATADLARANPDLSREVYTFDGRRIRQITEGTIGSSWGPSTDAHGRRIAFATDADTPGVVYSSGSSEVVVATRGGGITQITFSEDGFDNEAPVLTESRARTDLTWISSSNLDGRNSNNARRIYRTRIADR